MTQDDIINAALECVDTPFRHQGRVLGEAMDCAGVVVYVCNRLGYTPLDAYGYGRVPVNGLIEQYVSMQEFFHCVSRDAAQPGDILLMRFAKEPQHLAVLGRGELIHSYETLERCVRHTLSSKWWARVVKVFRFNEVTS